ncbi:hypothetical protein GCM10023149_01020 [Mucilaginibacter gynuensis]|uniref:Transglycosylase SLT domain-containing protein n=2 Tax=Mucilaginibacter gynuensis TaxID=1302236 RepID=A0ABP8FMX2_9SPHI
MLWLLFVSSQSFALDYRELFGYTYIKAERNTEKLRPILQKYAGQYKEDAVLMEAVIFPEVMRYNKLYNAIETGSLISLYSRFGSVYSDFSIGLLQMKPTFALSIEQYLLKHKDLPWVKELGFDKLSVKADYESRMARVDRLNNTEWQIKYLVAMLKCIELKHSILNTASADEKLRFIAAAYNCGWNKPTKVINSYISKKFYHIDHWASDTYSFSDVALYRYNELNKPA